MKFQYTPAPKTTTTTTTTSIMETDGNTVETQAAQAAEQLISKYLSPSDFIEELPDLFDEINPPPSPPPPPTPSTQQPDVFDTTEIIKNKPASPPVDQKNIRAMKEIHDAQNPAQPASKRRRVANITPHSNEGGRAGRPTRHETLSKLANENQDRDAISSKPGGRERGRGNGNTSSVPIRDAGFAGGKTF
jgi:hypothetical protein